MIRDLPFVFVGALLASIPIAYAIDATMSYDGVVGVVAIMRVILL